MLEYDLNGNLINDGTRTFEWDAENRLVAINQGGNIRTEFTYDGQSRWVRLVEKTDGNVISTNNLVWAGLAIAEERDAVNTVTKRYYPQRVQVGSANYFYTRDHLGSIRELTDSTEVVQARYDYDPNGRWTKISGSMDADFGFTGHYQHVASGLTLAPYRAYDAHLGRWISRDPLGDFTDDLILNSSDVLSKPTEEEIEGEQLPIGLFDLAELQEGPNLYRYATSNPTTFVDSDGKAVWVPIIAVGYGAYRAYRVGNAVYKSYKAAQAAQQAYKQRSIICKSAKAARDAMRRAGKPKGKLGRDRHFDPRGRHGHDKNHDNFNKVNYHYRW